MPLVAIKHEELWIVCTVKEMMPSGVTILNCYITPSCEINRKVVMEIIKPSFLRLDSLNYNPTSEIDYWSTFLAISDGNFVLLLLTVMPCRAHWWKWNWWKGQDVNCLFILSPQIQRFEVEYKLIDRYGWQGTLVGCELMISWQKIKVMLSWGKKISVVAIASINSKRC